MSYKDNLPKTADELKALSFDERARLWAKYSKYPFKRQLRSLWYYAWRRQRDCFAALHSLAKFADGEPAYFRLPFCCGSNPFFGFASASSTQ